MPSLNVSLSWGVKYKRLGGFKSCRTKNSWRLQDVVDWLSGVPSAPAHGRGENVETPDRYS
jgi:hypothetical protein